MGGALLDACGETRATPQAALPPRVMNADSGLVIVAANERLGDAAQIGDFLGAGGALHYVSRDAAHPVVQAWQRVRCRQITFETLHAEDPVDRWITVSRTPNGIVTNFSEYDGYLGSFRTNLGATPYVYLGNMPRALSLRPDDNNHYQAYSPRDMRPMGGVHPRARAAQHRQTRPAWDHIWLHG